MSTPDLSSLSISTPISTPMEIMPSSSQMEITTVSTRPVRAVATIPKNYVDYQLSDGNISEDSDEDFVQSTSVKTTKKRARKDANKNVKGPEKEFQKLTNIYDLSKARNQSEDEIKCNI